MGSISFQFWLWKKSEEFQIIGWSLDLFWYVRSEGIYRSKGRRTDGYLHTLKFFRGNAWELMLQRFGQEKPKPSYHIRLPLLSWEQHESARIIKQYLFGFDEEEEKKGIGVSLAKFWCSYNLESDTWNFVLWFKVFVQRSGSARNTRQTASTFLQKEVEMPESWTFRPVSLYKEEERKKIKISKETQVKFWYLYTLQHLQWLFCYTQSRKILQ